LSITVRYPSRRSGRWSPMTKDERIQQIEELLASHDATV
jgi:hypothetical protein